MAEQRQWPATEVELVAIETLVPYAGNARKHTERQIETISGLMQRFGFTNPILRDENGQIIAGHARLKAALLKVPLSAVLSAAPRCRHLPPNLRR